MHSGTDSALTRAGRAGQTHEFESGCEPQNCWMTLKTQVVWVFSSFSFFKCLCSRVQGAVLCVCPFPPHKGASFRPAVGPEPRMCRVQTAAPLHPVSASALVSTTGGHFPASLCLCYGKRTRSPPERNWQTITLGGKAAKTQRADCKYGLGEGKKGPN